MPTVPVDNSTEGSMSTMMNHFEKMEKSLPALENMRESTNVIDYRGKRDNLITHILAGFAGIKGGFETVIETFATSNEYDELITASVHRDKLDNFGNRALDELSRRSSWFDEIQAQKTGSSGPNPPRDMVEQYDTLKHKPFGKTW